MFKLVDLMSVKRGNGGNEGSVVKINNYFVCEVGSVF